MAKHFNIADLYEMVADKVPTRSALVCGEQRATYAELEQRVTERTAQATTAAGGPGSDGAGADPSAQSDTGGADDGVVDAEAAPGTTHTGFHCA